MAKQECNVITGLKSTHKTTEGRRSGPRDKVQVNTFAIKVEVDKVMVIVTCRIDDPSILEKSHRALTIPVPIGDIMVTLEQHD